MGSTLELSNLLSISVDLKTLYSLQSNQRFYNHIKDDLILLFSKQDR